MWENDVKFVAWLDTERLGTDEEPLGDEVLELMHRAWKAGQLDQFDIEEDFTGDYEEIEELDFEE